jgi:gamma-glutamylputrescine oxidase
MNFSYWEFEGFFRDADIIVVGAGIVGLSAAIEIKTLHPQYNVLVLEKGTLNDGASSKNAGFACFGSASELLGDMETMSEMAVLSLVEMRFQGLKRLRSLLGEKALGFEPCGGHELFSANERQLYEKCAEQLDRLNRLLSPIVGGPTYTVNPTLPKQQGFGKITQCITNAYEGSIHTGNMIRALIDLAREKDIRILNGIEVESVQSTSEGAVLKIENLSVKCKRLVICTNGFARQFLPARDVIPARNQVIVTSEIPGLKVDGTFHMNEGYVYFRNINQRILIGGFRHLSKEEETTSSPGSTSIIQKALNDCLTQIVIPEHSYSIDYSWSGIMGVGQSKEVIVEEVQPNILCAVRLGGMGVAIGTLVGARVAALV